MTERLLELTLSSLDSAGVFSDPQASAQLVYDGLRTLDRLRNPRNVSLLVRKLLRSPLWETIEPVDLAYKIVSMRKMIKTEELHPVFASAIGTTILRHGDVWRKGVLAGAFTVERPEIYEKVLRKAADALPQDETVERRAAVLATISFTDARVFGSRFVVESVGALHRSRFLQAREKELGVYTRVVREMLDNTPRLSDQELLKTLSFRSTHFLSTIGILERLAEKAPVSKRASDAGWALYETLKVFKDKNEYPQWQAIFALASDLVESKIKDYVVFCILDLEDPWSKLVLETHADQVPHDKVSSLVDKLLHPGFRRTQKEKPGSATTTAVATTTTGSDLSSAAVDELSLSVALSLFTHHFGLLRRRVTEFVDVLVDSASERQLRLAVVALYRAGLAADHSEDDEDEDGAVKGDDARGGDNQQVQTDPGRTPKTLLSRLLWSSQGKAAEDSHGILRRVVTGVDANDSRFNEAYIDLLPAIPTRHLLKHLRRARTLNNDRFIEVITTQMDPDRAEVVVTFMNEGLKEIARL
ncbi:hypothetical protein PYCC9005_005496 [Savitreella phatthalungensis]